MNPRTGTTTKRIEDAEAEVHRHARQAGAYAITGDYRRARAEAEAAQGAARQLKEMLGALTRPPISR
jgi:hypothetical protein